MVIRILTLFSILVGFTLELYSQPVKVYAYTDSDVFVNKPVMGTVEVEHANTDVIDKNSFRIDGKPLQVEQIKEVRYSPNDPLTLTIFRFQLPSMPLGAHDLPPIFVTLGGKAYASAPSKFEVRKPRASLQQREPPQRSSSEKKSSGEEKKTGKPVFILEAFAEPNSSLYPGQRIRVGYRYYFDHSINATKEELPLLEAEGFKKIGGKLTRTAQDESLSLLEVAQEIEAVKPGEYTFGPSVYEGIPLDGSGQEMDSKVSSEAATVTITVAELPEKLKPASYKSAIGLYSFATELVSPANVEVGEKMVLRLVIRGAPLEGVELPDICCQPGMAGRFHFSDIPPPPIYKDGTLSFDVDIRPIDAEIREIPSLEFSYFNPNKEIYQKSFSNTIPIKVKPIVPEEESKKAEELWPKMDVTPQPISLASIKKLSSPFVFSKLFINWWGLLTIPLIIGAVFFQVNLKIGLENYRETELQMTSNEILQQLQNYSVEELPGRLRDCFVLKMVELGLVEKFKPYEEIGEGSSQLKVKAFLRKVDAGCYSEERMIPDELIAEAHVLYKEIS